jgi:hypothetical protein
MKLGDKTQTVLLRILVYLFNTKFHKWKQIYYSVSNFIISPPLINHTQRANPQNSPILKAVSQEQFFRKQFLLDAIFPFG